MLSVLLVVGYLNQIIKKHLSWIGRHWTWFFLHLLVKNKQHVLKKFTILSNFIPKEKPLKEKKSTTEKRIVLISLFEKKCQITLISQQKQSESFVLIYERLKVIIWLFLPNHVQNTNSIHNNNETQLLWYKE